MQLQAGGWSEQVADAAAEGGAVAMDEELAQHAQHAQHTLEGPGPQFAVALQDAAGELLALDPGFVMQVRTSSEKRDLHHNSTVEMQSLFSVKTSNVHCATLI